MGGKKPWEEKTMGGKVTYVIENLWNPAAVQAPAPRKPAGRAVIFQAVQEDNCR